MVTSADDKIVHLTEQPIASKRLGRHVRHDPRSWLFPAPMAAKLGTIRWERLVGIYDQGDLGMCTGTAGAGCVSTSPFKKKLTLKDARALYSAATKIDGFRGQYPPTDTGSSGLAVMKALKAKKWIKKYTHGFSLEMTLKALMLRPGITGFAWRTGCDDPNGEGIVSYTGAVRGGHEVELVGYDDARRLVWFANSWGAGWGLGGYFAMTVEDYAAALADDGDATFPEL